jgi:hypothetical protein
MDLPIRPVSKLGQKESNHKFEVGDIIKKSGMPLRSGAQAWGYAVVISMEPFIITSLCATMRWSATVSPDQFTKHGKAKAIILNPCMQRLHT